VVEESGDLAGTYRSVSAINLPSSVGMEPTSELVYKRLRVGRTRRGEESRGRVAQDGRASEQVDKEEENEREKERA
jgi:hypothetical protein